MVCFSSSLLQGYKRMINWSEWVNATTLVWWRVNDGRSWNDNLGIYRIGMPLYIRSSLRYRFWWRGRVDMDEIRIVISPVWLRRRSPTSTRSVSHERHHCTGKYEVDPGKFPYVFLLVLLLLLSLSLFFVVVFLPGDFFIVFLSIFSFMLFCFVLPPFFVLVHENKHIVPANILFTALTEFRHHNRWKLHHSNTSKWPHSIDMLACLLQEQYLHTTDI